MLIRNSSKGTSIFGLQRVDFDYFPLPSLRSSSESLIELCYISIGQKESNGTIPTLDEINGSRHASEKAMGRYMHNLNTSLDKGCGLGTSIVRKYDLQDETHFAIEQRISVHLPKGSDAHTGRLLGVTPRALN